MKLFEKIKQLVTPKEELDEKTLEDLIQARIDKAVSETLAKLGKDLNEKVDEKSSFKEEGKEEEVGVCNTEEVINNSIEESVNNDSYQDWPGWYSYEELKEICLKNNILRKYEYDVFRSENLNNEIGMRLPPYPERVYSEWQSFREFFFEIKKKNIVDYETFKEIVRNRGLDKAHNYPELRRRIPEKDSLPTNPYLHYGKDWEGWTTIIGTPRKQYDLSYRRLGYYSFEELKALVRKHNIQYPKEYEMFRSTHTDGKKMPARLFEFYASEWKGWEDFLGNAKREKLIYSKNKAPYEEFLKFIEDNKIFRYSYYGAIREMSPLKDSLPSQPQVVYKEYEGWRKIVYKLMKRNKEYEQAYFEFSFKNKSKINAEPKLSSQELHKPTEASETNKKEGGALLLHPPRVMQDKPPLTERLVTRYSMNKDGTVNLVSKPSINSLLAQQKKDGILPFEEAREKIRKFKFKSKEEFENYIFKPSGIPPKPDVTYFLTGWDSWDDFLGTDPTN